MNSSVPFHLQNPSQITWTPFICSHSYHLSPMLLMFQVLIKGFGVHLRDMCSTTTLEDFVNISDERVARFTQDLICSAPNSWLDQAERHFKSNLDFLKPFRVRNMVQWIKMNRFDAGRLDSSLIHYYYHKTFNDIFRNTQNHHIFKLPQCNTNYVHVLNPPPQIKNIK